MTIKTTASIKKITSGKGVEIVLCLPSSVSLDDLNELKQRDEFYLTLGISQMELHDYTEPRRGLQVVEKAGVIESVTNPDSEEGKQLEIGDVEEEEESTEEDTGIEYSDDSDSETETESESEEDTESEVVDEEEVAEDDKDKPLTFVDEELPF